MQRVEEANAGNALLAATTGVSAWRDAAYDIGKRAFDVVGALVALLVLMPLVLVVSSLILVSTGGPVFYRHRRGGRNGVTFDCWKFRTMVPGAEHLVSDDGAFAVLFREQYKVNDDPRVTKLGRVLRRTSIDEVPQFWNILRGDMSLVGPRPVTPAELEMMYGMDAAFVFSVRPGLTGLWQISGRSEVLYNTRVQLDLDYVRTRSFRRDLAILLRTPVALFRGAK